ncbi:hypothetical protein, partial [Phaeobacter gallaeciensis]|uniref:hypothetical protein n=1 Tax=Phaeobacter gallaeciensis TaxID=60890 RepID=UPI00237F2EE0
MQKDGRSCQTCRLRAKSVGARDESSARPKPDRQRTAQNIELRSEGMINKDIKPGFDELRDVRRRNRGLFWSTGVFSFFVNMLMLTGPL